MSELKLVVENDSDSAVSQKPDLSTMNPLDALNRRDIELIKKSLVSMHKDSADLRSTMIALHERNCSVPSRSFFISLGLIWFVGIGVLTVARPQLHAAWHHMSGLTRVSANEAQQ